jgi:hypothetical protein|tara:strand:- start:658 stop:903 length:246 start_codon:yes stop_codon:yes gene_type:complete
MNMRFFTLHLIEQCGFGITAPPPVADRVSALYDDIRSENAGLAAGGIALPETTDALPEALAADFPTPSTPSTSSFEIYFSA